MGRLPLCHPLSTDIDACTDDGVLTKFCQPFPTFTSFSDFWQLLFSVTHMVVLYHHRGMIRSFCHQRSSDSSFLFRCVATRIFVTHREDIEGGGEIAYSSSWMLNVQLQSGMCIVYKCVQIRLTILINFSKVSIYNRKPHMCSSTQKYI